MDAADHASAAAGGSQALQPFPFSEEDADPRGAHELVGGEAEKIAAQLPHRGQGVPHGLRRVHRDGGPRTVGHSVFVR